jgi:tRNA nucleotidyltransferase (CCA-adding enzyme)
MDLVLAALAGERGVYVVGGAVRDKLLGRVPKELDLVVEGDAIAVAKRAAERVGGALTVHERFGTATVSGDGYAFDLASARRETYERPGALPTVQLGASIAEDLERRDFTVNAIAEHVQTGERLAVAHAYEDLERRTLRVLHERSFIDDPTRMLRLVRYAARLGFTPHDEHLIDPALLDTVSGDRIGNEIRLMLYEPPAAWRELQRLGLAQQLFGDRFEATTLDLRGPLALAACTTDVPDLAQRLEHLKFPARERDVILDAATNFHRLEDAHGTDAELWRRFRRERPETIELLAAAGHAGARRWRDHIRHRRLEITGGDLVRAGLTGPQVGEGLAKATVAMLEGRAPDRRAQLKVALM